MAEGEDFQTTGVQTDPDDSEDVRGSSGLSWPSSYRSSRLLTPETHRLLDSQLGDSRGDARVNAKGDARGDARTDAPLHKTQTLKLPHIYQATIEEEEEASVGSRKYASPHSDGFQGPTPPLKCSLYTAIGNPSMAKRRKKKPAPLVHWPKDNRKAKQGLSQKWKRGNNELDDKTIYSTKQQRYYDKVSSRTPVLLPPIQIAQSSPCQIKADATSAREKEIVMRNFFLTGKMKRFEEDKAVLPTVYRNLLDDSAKKRVYVNTLYSHHTGLKRETSGADCSKRKFLPNRQCEFCDVMGNRYCSYCIEFKNRHFALGYEKNFMLPQLPVPVQRHRKRDRSHLAGILINAHDGLGQHQIP
jgi:hypothetical protein